MAEAHETKVIQVNDRKIVDEGGGYDAKIAQSREFTAELRALPSPTTGRALDYGRTRVFISGGW